MLYRSNLLLLDNVFFAQFIINTVYSEYNNSLTILNETATAARHLESMDIQIIKPEGN